MGSKLLFLTVVLRLLRLDLSGSRYVLMYLEPKKRGARSGYHHEHHRGVTHRWGPGHSRVRALLLGLGQLAAPQHVDLQLLLGRVVAQGELDAAPHGHAAQLALAVQAHQAAAQLRGGGQGQGGLER